MYHILIFIFLWNFILNALAWIAWFAYYFHDFRVSTIP